MMMMLVVRHRKFVLNLVVSQTARFSHRETTQVSVNESSVVLCSRMYLSSHLEQRTVWVTLLTSRSLVSVAWRHLRDVTPPLPARASLVTSGISSVIAQPYRPVSGPVSGPISRSTAHRSSSTATAPFIAWSSSTAAIASATITSAVAPMSWFATRT